MNTSPPKWADRFLRWYCHPYFLEEIEGDIYELFEKRVKEKGLKNARSRFVWDVFRFFRWSNIKRSNSNYSKMNQFLLFKNYLKLGLRNIRRNLISSSINIFGLAIAICFAISIFVFTDIMRNMDSFLTNRDRIFMITNYVEQDGGDALWCDSPIMLGPKIASDHPTVEAFSRVEYRYASVKNNADVFDELTLFVDPAYFEMFDYPFVSGNRKVLYDKNKIVIGKATAKKYFDGEDPIGKDLSFKFSNGTIKRLTVGAVLEKHPYNSSMVYEIYLPIENYFDLGFENKNDWSFMTDATFIMMKKGESISSVMDSFDEYLTLQNESDPEWKVTSFKPFVLSEVSENSYQIVSSVSGGSHPAGKAALIVIAIFLLAMACFNYMNIAVVGAAKRLKEIALRKVMGSVRGEIIKQFLVENTLQCFFALILGTVLAYFMMVPWFNALIPEIDIKFRTAEPMSMVVFFVSLLLIVGLVSGAYPSLYISKFDVITIFKGKEKFGSKNVFSKMMLGVQFFLSVITIVGCFVFLDQSIYLGEKDWGYNPEQTMSIFVADESQYELLKNEVIKHPAVELHTASSNLIGRSLGVSSVPIEDRKIAIRRIGVLEGFEETFGLRLTQGRALTDLSSDQNGAVIINEKLIESMGWDEANVIGKTFTLDSIRRTVVGVVENFHYYDFYSPIDPVIIHGAEPSDVHYLTVKATKNKLAELDMFAQEAWLRIAPNDPYDRIFQEEVFDDFYEENTSNITLIMMITVIAIILACLGLYGLLSFNVQGNLKEYSVRKVLGANPRTIVKVVSKQYVWILLISFIIGAPLGAVGMMALVEQVFPDSKAVDAFPFIVSMVLMLLTLVITVAGQINKAIKVNPAELLRSE